MEQVEKMQADNPSLLGMITDPRAQFEKVRDNPKILGPLIFVTIITFIGTILMAMNTSPLENDPMFAGLSDEELAVAIMVTQLSLVIVGLVTPVVSILIMSIIIILIAKAVRSDVSFKQLFSMNTFIYFIVSLSFIVTGLVYIIFQVSDPNVSITSLNALVRADGAFGALLNTIEVFSIWALVLTAIGLQVIAKLSKGLSWTIAIIFIILTFILNILGAV